jgi:hypothetical protein
MHEDITDLQPTARAGEGDADALAGTRSTFNGTSLGPAIYMARLHARYESLA